MKLLFALAFTLAFSALVATAAPFSESTYQSLFTSWMRENDKVYSPFEFHERYQTWKANFDWIYEFPITNPDATFTVEMNALGDLTDEEYNNIYNGLRLSEPYEFKAPEIDERPLLGLASSVDWRQKGIVAPVKNQGQCGSCWAFSAAGALESAHAQKTGSLVRLSEQNLVDCSTSFGNHGCNGGLMDYAFRYVISNRGMAKEADYPYEARDATCRYKKETCGSTLAAFKQVTSYSESALQAAVAVGPVSVAIDASPSTFRFYKSGVYYDASCSSTRLNHGVLAVGYGTEGGADYWLVKNSWGADWGNGGYILMARNRNNNCGIATMSSYPLSAGAGNC